MPSKVFVERLPRGWIGVVLHANADPVKIVIFHCVVLYISAAIDRSIEIGNAERASYVLMIGGMSGFGGHWRYLNLRWYDIARSTRDGNRHRFQVTRCYLVHLDPFLAVRKRLFKVRI